MIISTGIATINEIMDAVEICRKTGNNDITLLKCTKLSCSAEEANLNNGHYERDIQCESHLIIQWVVMLQ